MSRTGLKQAAQDKLMQRLADSLLIASEEGEDTALIDEMRKQSVRIGKMFGYMNWPGIGEIS